MTARLCLDLCSGLGGFSAAFSDAGWEVITVDNDARFNPTICADVCNLVDDAHFMALRPEVILASPPCERFSRATHVWPLPGIGKALSAVGACLEIIVALKPKYWALENPAGRLHWFIGKPAMRLRINAFGYRTVKPTELWGNMPLGLVPDSPKHNKELNAFANFYSKNRARRAKMPYGLSKAILQAVTNGAPSGARPTLQRLTEPGENVA